ncbi:hypothetical protein EKK58_05265 [Candidatus Dependentiae bacterium]|nr:MAG: hypothetical protein EKK58_05265 [Candidatus Dependentiae bacterium]
MSFDEKKIRQRIAQIDESLEVGRDISPNTTRWLLSKLEDALDEVDRLKREPSVKPALEGESLDGYQLFTASQFAQELVDAMRSAQDTLSQAWSVAKNPAKPRIMTARNEVQRLLRVLAAGAKFAIMTNKDVP